MTSLFGDGEFSSFGIGGASNGGRTSSWRRLIESGAFDNCYPQRISACFEYLDADSLSFFTLKDLTERGKFVFSNLCIAAPQGTSFAVMDFFRLFDRSGTGKVRVEDFVVGIVQYWLNISSNAKLMSEFSHEILQQLAFNGTAASILSSFNDTTPPSKLHGCPLFTSNLLAIKYRIEVNVQKKIPNRGLSEAVLRDVLVVSVEEVVAEMLLHFHLPTGRVGDVLAEDSMYGVAGGNVLDQLMQQLKNVSSAKHRLQTLPVVWNPFTNLGPGGVSGISATDSNGAFTSTLKSGWGQITPRMRRKSLFNSSAPRTGMGAVRDDDQVDDEAERSAAAAASKRRNTVSFRQSVVSTIQPPMSGSRGSVDALVGYLASMGVPLDGSNADEAMGRLDSCQLFLLQTACKSLDSFFSLMVQDVVDQADGAGAVGVADESAGSSRGLDTQLRSEGLRMLLCGDEDGDNAAAFDTSESIRSDVSGATLRDRVRSHSLARSILPPASSQAPIGSTETNKSGAKRAKSVEGELAQTLAEKQDDLRRANMRIEILEMVQTQVVSQMPPLSQSNTATFEDEEPVSKDEYPANDSFESPLAPPSQREGGDAKGSLDKLFSATGGFGETKDEPAAMNEDNERRQKRDAIFGLPARGLPPVSFDDILGELAGIRALVASRGSSSSALGHLLREPSIIMPLKGRCGINSTLANLTNLSERMSARLRGVRLDRDARIRLEEKLEAVEELQEELKTSTEQIKQEQMMHMSTAIELQMSREDLKRLQVENVNARTWERALSDHKTKLKEKDNEVEKLRRELDDLRNDPELGGNQTQVSLLKESEEMKKKYDILERDKDRISMENSRLERSFKHVTKNHREALLNNQELQKQMHAAIDELAECQHHIQQLTGSLLDQSALKTEISELKRKLEVFRHQMEEKDKELFASRTLAESINKMREDIITRDKENADLEVKVNKLQMQADLAEPAEKNLVELRAKLRQCTKESNEIKTFNHMLGIQLQELKSVKEHNEQLVRDLQEYKSKFKGLPKILKDLAKARASARANAQTVKDTFEELNQLRTAKKLHEREINDLRLNVDRKNDIESKLKACEEEIQKTYLPVSHTYCCT